MGIVYIVMAFAFIILLFVNVVWLGINLYQWATNGIQYLLQGMNFAQRLYYSIYLKWILLADVVWLAFALVFALERKHYKTDPDLHYLKYSPIRNPSICVVIPTYNESLAIETVVKDFLNQENVKDVIVVDNHSTDNTVDIAEKAGAKVIRKKQNMGFAHSCVMGFREALKTDANMIALAEGEGTCNGYDLKKMTPYLDNCDMVVGSRQLQVLSERGNQIKMISVWGNFFLAKLIQIKFFSLLHMGVVSFTDVGCTYRMIRRESLEKIIPRFTRPETDEVIPGLEITAFTSVEALNNNLRIVEVPITFNKRIGISKTGSDRKLKAIKIGLIYLWYILKS